MDSRIGTCSICGGPVIVPAMMVNPVPHCANCGAIAQNPHGPIIPMQPRRDPINYNACTCGTTAICPIHGGTFA